MPEITHFPPPGANNVISEEEFLAALGGHEFKQTDYFYRIKGENLISSPLYNEFWWVINPHAENKADEGYLNLDDEFLIIMNASLPLIPRDFEDDIASPCIFYKCVLPAFLIYECTGNDFYFIGSHIESITTSYVTNLNIHIEEKSFCGNIVIDNECECKHLTIAGNSQCNDIYIRENCTCDDIKIEKNSKAGILYTIENCKIDSISVLENSKCGTINISEGSVCKASFIHNNSECEGFFIHLGGVASHIQVIESKIESIVFSENSQNIYGIFISDSECRAVEITKNCLIHSIQILLKSEVSRLSIKDESLCGSILIENESKCGNVLIDKNSICPQIEIDNSRVNEMSLFKNMGSMDINNATVSLLRLYDCYLHELAWKAGTRGEVYIQGGTINHLNLYQMALLRDVVFSLINVQIYITQLQELLVHGQLIFRNIHSVQEPFTWGPVITKAIEEKKQKSKNDAPLQSHYHSMMEQLHLMENKYKEDLVQLSDKFKIEEKPLFRIVDSSLGKTEITGCDLEAFHFEYRDSKLLETFFSGTKLPKDKIKIYGFNIKDHRPDTAFFEQKVSIYNQLKRIYDNQGDIVEATWYHSKAMDNQERLLKERYKKDGGRWFGEQNFDLFTFRLNKLTNNHGESWRKALRFILLSSFAMCCLYYLSLHYRETPSLQATDRFVRNYFLFLDPTHKIEFLAGKKPLWWVPVFIDFLGRILMGYGIFQFIAAFRRHGRKSG